MKFTVHSAVETTIDVPAITAEGIGVKAPMPAFIVELLPVDPWRRSLTIIEPVKTDEDRATLKATYAEGGTVEFAIVPAE